FDAPVSFNPGGTNNVAVSIGDYDRDGRADVAVSNFDDGTVSVLLNRTPYRPALDLNGDGREDILFQNQANGDIAFWLMKGTTQIQAAFISPVNPGSLDWKVV